LLSLHSPPTKFVEIIFVTFDIYFFHRREGEMLQMRRLSVHVDGALALASLPSLISNFSFS
jgi:hypothetical protein